MIAPHTTSTSYEIGYRKPPRHTQFQKGQSGNPGGRPRRPARRLEDLALYEAYRTTVVMEDGHAEPMPAIQAVLRSQLQSAAGGNVRAQRDILAMIRDIELIRRHIGLFENGGAGDVVDDDHDADAIDGNDNDVDDTDDADDGDDDVDDTADADRDDACGADDDEPAWKQADGIDTYGERRQAERETTAQPAVGAPHPEDAPAPRAGWKPSPPSRSGGGQRRRVRPCRNGPERSAGVQPARPQPGRRRRSRRSTPAKPGSGIRKVRGVRRTGRMPDPARPRLQAGTPARKPTLLDETKN